MKTPREILLDSHRAAEPDLDAIRRDVIANLRAAPIPSRRWTARFATRWHEIFRQARPARLALGAAWLLIIGLNLASSETESAPLGRSAQTDWFSPQETLQALREQRRLFLELVNTSWEQPEVDRFVPRPRGEAKPTWACA